MAQKRSLFAGEWWSPEWPSLSLPPDPQPQDRSAMQTFEADLEWGAKVPLPDGDSELMLKTYPARVEEMAACRAMDEFFQDWSPPIFYFRFLRHYNLTCISHKLHYLQTQVGAGVVLSYEDSEELTKLLRDQAAAIRDYEYTRTHLIPYSPARNYSIRSFLGGIFPEIEISKNSGAQWSGAYYQLPDASIRSSRLGRVVSSFLPRALAYSKAERTDKVVHYMFGLPPKQISLPVRIVASTIVAVSGGALLIVPMVIMSFNTNRNKSLITVSCAVLLFAFFLAAVMRSKTTEIFIATATYAAVLVVFVGTGTGMGTGSG